MPFLLKAPYLSFASPPDKNHSHTRRHVKNISVSLCPAWVVLADRASTASTDFPDYKRSTNVFHARGGGTGEPHTHTHTCLWSRKLSGTTLMCSQLSGQPNNTITDPQCAHNCRVIQTIRSQTLNVLTTVGSSKQYDHRPSMCSQLSGQPNNTITDPQCAHNCRDNQTIRSQTLNVLTTVRTTKQYDHRPSMCSQLSGQPNHTSKQYNHLQILSYNYSHFHLSWNICSKYNLCLTSLKWQSLLVGVWQLNNRYIECTQAVALPLVNLYSCLVRWTRMSNSTPVKNRLIPAVVQIKYASFIQWMQFHKVSTVRTSIT